jgi:predicted ATPase/class 3 adenylate cyclase
MSNHSETFGRLLKGAVGSIAAYEGKAAQAVEDELGAQIGVAGSAIQRYKAGYLPPEPRAIQILAESAVRRGFLSRAWLGRFLQAARYPNPDALVAQLADILMPAGAAHEPRLPSGTLAFLFTDIAGSTTLWEQHAEAMERALARHDAIMRQTIDAYGGHVFKAVGDAFYAVFTTAVDALDAALAAQRAIVAESWGAVDPIRVRAALHVGAAQQRDGDYFGPPLNRVARLCAAGHGGQVLLSNAAQELSRDALPKGVSLRDLGEHRLKDLARPERVFQVVAPGLIAGFPPLRTLDSYRHNLPAQPTPLIGREDEVRSVCELARRSNIRLLTLSGPGGIGKTRLALQAAAELLDDFRDGIWFVALASLRDPQSVAAAVAQALGVKEDGDQSLVDLLKVYLREKHTLLLLDNFEHLAVAAPLVADLLAAAPDLKTIITSREVLHLYGEHEYAVPPLSIPDMRRLPPIERLTQYEAVRLFIERVQAVRPDFVVTADNAPAVAEICARLDGLPLAIELAAARCKLFPPHALLARLDKRLSLLTGGPRDLPARQQTLRGAIAWSYDLLDAAEQALFARLGVFVGSCALEAAEAVLGDDGRAEAEVSVFIPSAAVLAGLSSLVDKSLVKQLEGPGDEPRFVMLETIREYALEWLEESGEGETLRERHARYFLALAKAAEPQRPDVTWAARAARLEAELDNLRAALSWSQTTAGDAGLGLELAKELLYVWMRAGHWIEARTWLTHVLAHPAASQRTVLRAQVLTGAGYMFGLLSDYVAAQAAFAESLAICEECGDTRERAWVLNRMGWLARSLGDTALVRSRLEESIKLYRELGDNDGIIEGLNTLGQAIIHEDVALATTLLEESLVLARSVGNTVGTAWALNHLGHVAEFEQDYGRATRLHRESLDLFRGLGEQHPGIPWAYYSLGACALAQGDLMGAQECFAAGLAQFRSQGSREGVAMCLPELGSIMGLSGRPVQAARLWGAAEALRRAIGWGSVTPANATYERAIATVRAELGDEAFVAARAEGLALTMEQAIAEALESTRV